MEILNPLNYSGWDDLLKEHDKSTFFHSSQWAKVLSETYEYKPFYFTKIVGGRLQLLIPVMQVESWLTGKRGVSLPFTDYCEPILPTDCPKTEMWEELVEFGMGAKWKYLEIRGGDGFKRVQYPSSWYYEHILDLKQRLQDIHSNFRDSNKRNIKKAQNAQIEICLGDSLDSMQQFYRLHCITRRRHGLPPPPFKFFMSLYENVFLKDSGILVFAKHNGKIIAAALALHFGKKAIFKYGASINNYQHFKPNNLVIWKMIEFYWHKGMESLSFGRTDPIHMGLKQFKDGWRSEEKAINYYRYNLNEKNFVHVSSPVDGWQTGIFQRTPIGLLKIFGRLLYRHMG